MSVRWLVWSFASPSQLLLGAVIAGALLLAFGRAKAGQTLCVTGGAGLLLFGLLPAASLLVRPLEARFPQPELPARITGIILISGAERPATSEAYGVPQLGAHAMRYVTALSLAAQHPESRIVHSGGVRVEPGRGALGTQTAVAAAILGSIGLDPARLTFEERSVDTCDNAGLTHVLVRPKSSETWVVVTSAVHMPRTIACFRSVGWEVVAQPTDYQAVPGDWGAGAFDIAGNLELLDLAAHEWMGLAYYRLTGRTREFLPSP